MLNKNQSKKWNSWKYSLVIPALIAFMFYFQVQMVAQEKEAPKVMVIAQDGIEVTVNKNSTDADLKNETEKAKKEGITLKFSKVKRNSNGEITAIKAEYKDQNGKKGTTQVSSDEPIKPLHFFKSGDRIGFGNARDKSVFIKGNADNVFSFSFDDEAPEAPEAPEIPEAPEAPEAPEMKRFNFTKSKTFSINKDNGKTTIIVDGEVIDVDPEKILAEMDPNMIETVRIMKSDMAGFNDENGVIYIDTKKITKEAMKTAEEGIKKARIEIQRAKPEIERAKKEIEASKPEIEKAKIEIEKAKVEMEQAKIEMQKAKIEMEKARVEIEKAKAELKKEKEKKK